MSCNKQKLKKLKTNLTKKIQSNPYKKFQNIQQSDKKLIEFATIYEHIHPQLSTEKEKNIQLKGNSKATKIYFFI